MLGTIVGLAEILAVVLVVDRLLLVAEAKGWINYRKKSGDPPPGPATE